MSEPTCSLVVVTGLSGAGRSTVVATLEDLGFFCVDNLPTPVVESTLAALAAQGVHRVALGIDVRVGTFFAQAPAVVDALRASGAYEVAVVFLDASDEALLRRFGSTRRPHPLTAASDQKGAEREAPAVLEGIRAERERLASLRARATNVVDTTGLSVHELRRRVVALFGPGAERQPSMRTRMVSFGFKYGVPVDADVVLDVRFLDNPYFVDQLRDQVGTDPAVRDYVLESAEGREYLSRALSLLEFCLPRYEREGKSYLTLAVGCTGGRHRSVAVSEELAKGLRSATNMSVEIVHRDILRDRQLEGRSSEIDVLGGGARGAGGQS